MALVSFRQATTTSMSSADGLVGVSTEVGGKVFDPLGLAELHSINPLVNPHPKVWTALLTCVLRGPIGITMLQKISCYFRHHVTKSLVQRNCLIVHHEPPGQPRPQGLDKMNDFTLLAARSLRCWLLVTPRICRTPCLSVWFTLWAVYCARPWLMILSPAFAMLTPGI